MYESIIRAFASYVEFEGNKESKEELWASYVVCLILTSGAAYGVLFIWLDSNVILLPYEPWIRSDLQQ